MTDDDSPSREARLRGTINYYQELDESNITAHLHIPDFFSLDPEAEMPYVVPDSFIAEEVGGRIPVYSSEGYLLDHEPLDFLLGSFLPGGFKNRWQFKKWAGDFYPANEPGFVDIDHAMEFSHRRRLSEYLPNVTEERLTPFRYNPEEVTVYFPEQLRVRFVTDDETAHFPYQLDPEHNHVYYSGNVPDNVNSDELLTLSSSDPSSRFFWFKIMDEKSGREDEFHLLLENSTNGLVTEAEFIPDATFIKAYYATLLTLYEDDRADIDQTQSAVVKYFHNDDQQTAFIASKESTQALSFQLSRDEVESVVKSALDSNPWLRHELRLARLYRLIWDRLFFGREGTGLIDNVYNVDPFHQALRAVDYWLQTRADDYDANCVTAAPIHVIEDILAEKLIRDSQDSPRRLRLFGQDHANRETYREEYLGEHADEVREVLELADDDEALYRFGEHVFVHSLQHAMATWATESGFGGSDFNAWYDETVFAPGGEGPYQVAVYDSVQGGSGTSKQLYRRLNNGTSDVPTALRSQSQCQISLSEDLSIELLIKYDPDMLYTLVRDPERLSELVVKVMPPKIEEMASENEIEEQVTLVRHRLSSLLETRPLARFYGVTADVYSRLNDRLLQTPGALEVALELEATPIFESEAERMYDRFASRETNQRDITELADRIEELTKQCRRACPDCLERRSCTHAFRYQTYMLDRRLLAEGLSRALGGEP